ncbi:hypothetical protein [Pelagibius sp. Alg239-R121]|uniref:hypothetical protein n=1 Tax=Pelagibius sp. Alg239-R121 TaxID=2993448 RepID=UPI0024A6E8D1|nr:hypothetical protein [Pelagibius sp. Alg239-R121]
MPVELGWWILRMVALYEGRQLGPSGAIAQNSAMPLPSKSLNKGRIYFGATLHFVEWFTEKSLLTGLEG